MASSTGPVRATAAALQTAAGGDDSAASAAGAPGAAADAASALSSVSARGRSASPGQYAGRQPASARGQPRVDAQGQRAGASLAWPEGSFPSPRTPRQHTAAGGVGTTELRLSLAAVAEAQRQGEAERRALARQVANLERRVSEHQSGPAAGRERWADLQGSVSGVLEEMQSLSRRVEGLDEKLRMRTASCEESVRQRLRELEQQMHGAHHKTALAVSTGEEMQKRHTARLRKTGQTIEELSRRLEAVEDSVRKPNTARGGALIDLAEMAARLHGIEQQQAALEDELHALGAAARLGAASSPMGKASHGTGGRSTTTSSNAPYHAGCEGDDDGEYESSLRSMERQLATLSARTVAQLDEHSAALANMRVRNESQEQRLSALVERCESALSHPLEALRAEMRQLRDHDRQEGDARLAKLESSLDALADTHEELGPDRRDFEDHPVIRRLTETAAAQHQALRRLQDAQHRHETAREPRLDHHDLLSSDDVSGLFMRLETMEQRLECVEQDDRQRELADKADRSELLRLDVALRELSEPLRRLSQRTATSETKTVALERRVEQLQEHSAALLQENAMRSKGDASSAMGGSSSQGVQSDEAAELLSRLGAMSGSLADLSARLLEVESAVGDTPARSSSKHAEHSASASENQVAGMVSDLAQQMIELSDKVDSDIRDLRTQHARAVADAVQRATSAAQAAVGSGGGAANGEVKAVGSQVEKLQKHVEDLARRKHFEDRHADGIAEALTRVAGAEDLLTSIQSDVEVLRSQGQEPSAAAAAQAEETAKLLARLREEVDELRSAHVASTSRRDDSGPSEDVKARLAKLQEDVSKLHERSAKAEGVDASVEQVKVLQAEHVQSLADLSKRMDQIKEDHAKLSDDKVTKQTHEASLSDLHGKVEKLSKGAVEEHSARLKELQEKHVQPLTDSVTKLQDELSQMRDKAPSSDVQIKLEQLASEHKEESSARLKEMQEKHMEPLKESVSRLQAEMKQMANEGSLKDLQSKMESLNKEAREDHAVRLKEMQEKHFQPLTDSVSKLQLELQQVRDEVQSKSGEASTGKPLSKDELDSFMSSLEADKAFFAKIDAKIERAVARVEETESSLAKPHVNVLTSEMKSELEGKIASLRQQVLDEYQELQNLRKQTKGVAASASATGPDGRPLMESIAAALQRVLAREASTASAEEQLCVSIAGLEDRLRDSQTDSKRIDMFQKRLEQVTQEARFSNEAVKESTAKELRSLIDQDKANFHKLYAQIQDAVGRLDAKLAGGEPPAETSSGDAASASGAAGSAALERSVAALRQQVTSELQALQDHQRTIASLTAGTAPGAAVPVVGSDSQAAELESQVKSLVRLVDEELKAAQAQQQKLKDLTAAPSGGAPGSQAGLSPGVAARLEESVRELAANVSEELNALRTQQLQLKEVAPLLTAKTPAKAGASSGTSATTRSATTGSPGRPKGKEKNKDEKVDSDDNYDDEPFDDDMRETGGN
eukprot:TRINITY_DN23828_c0_g6_i1.p1 TRINITY_DN23828_c0_g6~~TRINITY_DN23828_c0_g6_i1.p1  ORF type:complete len:1516 (-),score=411.09 TRINITY_DN23828_c0_g6_i1:124-4560(-)